jgi:hypothetical protein
VIIFYKIVVFENCWKKEIKYILIFVNHSVKFKSAGFFQNDTDTIGIFF